MPIKSEKQASLGKFSRTSGTFTGLDLSILRRAFSAKAHGFELVNDQIQSLFVNWVDEIIVIYLMPGKLVGVTFSPEGFFKPNYEIPMAMFLRSEI